MVENAKDKLLFALSEKNGIIEEEKILSEAGDYREKGALKFFLDLFDDISFEEIPGELEASWKLDDFDISEWRKIKNGAKEILNDSKNHIKKRR